jgi:PAS domain S-box-containing protein
MKLLHDIETAFEHMPVGVALFDAHDLRLLIANASFLKFLDTYLAPPWKHGRAMNHPLQDWLPEAVDVEAIVAIFRMVAETGISHRADEYAFSPFENNVSYWNATLDSIRGDEGYITQLLVTVSEVTAQVMARQQAEQAHASLLQEHQAIEAERKRLAVIAMVARSVQQSLDIEHVSQAAIQAISSSFNPLYVYVHIADPEHQALRLLRIHPVLRQDQARRAVQYVPYKSSYPIAKAYQRHTPIMIEDLQTAATTGTIEPDNQLVTTGARGYVCVPLWFGDHFEGTLTALFQEPIASEGPEVQALIGCSMHIATSLAHTRLHAAVENERARLHAVIDQLPEGIVITEASDGLISYANAAAADILGIPLTHLIGAPLHRYPQSHLLTDLGGQPVLPWNFTVIHALCGETISSQEAMVIRPDGSHVVTLSSAAPIRRENGLITGAAIVFQDITRQKSIEQQKNEFLSIASHELRTPLTVLQGFAEILQLKTSQGQHLDEASQRAITNMIEQSQCLSRLIDEMLDISHIERDQFSLHPASHDLLKTLLFVIESQASTTRQHHLRLVLEGLQQTDTLIGWFDEGRMIQVLSNLMSNAIKYSPTGGEIEIGLRHTSTEHDEALIWVKDVGIGIPADEIPHIFERFHRASNLNRSVSGLGIGLYLAKELVTRHGGRIWVESTEGRGSTFYIRLPLHQHTT